MVIFHSYVSLPEGIPIIIQIIPEIHNIPSVMIWVTNYPIEKSTYSNISIVQLPSMIAILHCIAINPNIPIIRTSAVAILYSYIYIQTID